MNAERILVVEDEAIIAADIVLTLEELGYSVVGTVDTAAAAVAVATETRPSLVLMDITLKGPDDGITAALALRQRNIPVVFLTAYASEEVLRRAREAEPYGYLLKPFEEAGLHSTIEMALARRGADCRHCEQMTQVVQRLVTLPDAICAELARYPADACPGLHGAMARHAAQLRELLCQLTLLIAGGIEVATHMRRES